MKQKFLSFVLSLLLIVSTLPTPALALETASAAREFEGSGTQTDPYCIESLCDLEMLRDMVNNGEVGAGEWFRLYADINMSLRYGQGRGEDGADRSWTPIGAGGHPFSGIFDGNGHTVTGLYINAELGYQALFYRVGKSGTVKNISVDGSVTSISNILIHDCTAGVAALNEGTVENCHSNVNVSGRADLGGVVGINQGTVRNCSNRGAVTGTNNYVGGVLGNNVGGTVENCYNIGPVSGANCVGGVTGRNYSNGKVTNCFNTGAVTGSGRYIGGVAGINEKGTMGEPVSVGNCFNTGTVTGGTGNMGGAVGYNNGSVTNCYYLDTCGASGASGVSKTAEEFNTLANLLGDPFEDSEFLGRPVLTSNFHGYLIPNLAALERFRDFVNAGKFDMGTTFLLTADIDMSGSYGAGKASWTPIGTDSHPFVGTFDGGGHRITGLYLHDATGSADNKGLFGTVGQDGEESIVQNLGVSGSVTALAGDIGGIVGRLNKGDIASCHYAGSVTGENGSIGGLVGFIGYGSATHCYNTGAVTGANCDIGGIAGFIDSGGVTSCYNTGTITPTDGVFQAGALVGGSSYSIYIGNCYYLNTCGAAGNGESKTAAEFASGEVAYLLQSDWGDNLMWGQALTGGSQEDFPVLTDDFSKAVCRVVFQSDGQTVSESYVNFESTAPLPAPDPVKTGYAFAGWYTQLGTDGDQFTAASAVQGDTTLYAQWKHIAPTVPSIDYQAETLATTTGTEYSIVTSGRSTPSWKACDADMAPTDFGWDGSEDVLVKFRTTATTGYHASDAVDLTIPSRPAAPTGLRGINETFAGENDGKITGVSAAMEYKLSTASSWTDCGGAEVAGLVPGIYQVRRKAVTATGSEAFASAAAAATIAKGVERTYTLNVTAPTFDAATYGDPQPEAKAIIISSSGNSDAAVAGVTASGSDFTIGGSGSTVAAGTSITTWTIRPNAGLSAGNHTATITVTYNNGATVAANVSFKVNGAPQNAPAAPELESKTHNSVTLKEIPANTNGAKAQYSRDGGNTWQDSPAFTGLSARTEYVFSARYDAIGSYEASQASAETKITTDAAPSSPPVIGEPKPCPRDETCPIAEFTDADPAVWYHDGVHYCLENGLMNGFGNGKFGPNDTLTRAELTQILYNKEGRPSVSPDSGFADAAKDMWYAKAISWAAQNDIAAGYGGGKFGPSDFITREQLAAILWRYDGSPEASGDLDRFTDGNKTSAWAVPAMQWAVVEGVMIGNGNGTITPTGKATRAEAATMMKNYCEKK